MASNPFDPLPPILRDFSREGDRKNEQFQLGPVENGFSKRIVGDKMYETRGFLDTRVTKRQRKPKEPEQFLIYGVPTNPAAPFGYKANGTAMSQPAYFGEPGAGEVERGGAVIRVDKSGVSVGKNKTWVTKDATATHQAHPGNRWWEDTRIERQRGRDKLSWWAPVGHFQSEYDTSPSTPWAATAELGSAPIAWRNGVPPPREATISTLGAPVSQGVVFIDGVKEKQLGRVVVAAALYVDGIGKKHIRFLAAPDTAEWWGVNGAIETVQMCSYSYDTDTITLGAWITDIYLRGELVGWPVFNSSGTKFSYEAINGFFYEVTFVTAGAVYVSKVDDLFPYVKRVNDAVPAPLIQNFANDAALEAGAAAGDGTVTIEHTLYSGDTMHIVSTAVVGASVGETGVGRALMFFDALPVYVSEPWVTGGVQAVVSILAKDCSGFAMVVYLSQQAGCSLLRIRRGHLLSGDPEASRGFKIAWEQIDPLDGVESLRRPTCLVTTGEDIVLLSSHYLYDPLNKITYDTEHPPFALCRTAVGKWRSLQNRLPGDQQTSLCALIAIDKEKGYYDDGDFI